MQARGNLVAGRLQLVHSGRPALNWPDARNQAEGGGH
jgi:hypothetical protein